MEPVTHLRSSRILDLPSQDRPREKMRSKGARSLSDSELLAILLRSGNADRSAVDLSRDILQAVNHNLSALSRLTLGDLCKFKGMGEAKAMSVLAALELGRRRRATEVTRDAGIGSSSDAFAYIGPHLEDLQHEEFWVILMNRANRVIGLFPVSSGGITGTVADPRVIFRLALEHHACGMILCHNHPSGQLKPSDADKALTRKLCEAGHNLEIQVLDHLIVGTDGYYSFADEGMLP
ncbi:MAG: DNA repair protein RadC [Flavobacteriales bacterium]|nr:DNA repair protein RadC [Flavobacteriales bacterium]MCB9448818.1 DNA repair protein RadC [Flavobacteriales bacterium]